MERMFKAVPQEIPFSGAATILATACALREQHLVSALNLFDEVGKRPSSNFGRDCNAQIIRLFPADLVLVLTCGFGCCRRSKGWAR